MFQYTADEVCEAIQGNQYDFDHQANVITALKAHIKRDFVDLTEVPRYFEALKLANKSQDFKLASLAFSSICHLIKRVGMQDPNSLRNSSKIVLPILLNRLLDSRSNFKSQAKSSLETFWLATPSIVENYIRDTALIHSNPKLRSESIMFISDLIELNKNFDFLTFVPNLVNLLRDDSIEVVKNIQVLFLKYFTLNRSKLKELVDQLKTQKIETKIAVKILRDLDSSVASNYAKECRAAAPTTTIDTFSNLAKLKKPSLSTVQTSGTSAILSTSRELQDIISKVSSAKLDDTVTPVIMNTIDDLHREVEKLLSPFQGKETEFNWNNREKNIVKFRGLIVGNSERYPEQLVQSTKVLFEGISKAISSLRTTLSSNGCQLVKELAAYLTKGIDQIAENLFQPLASLTSATKKISSLNAFGSICVLLTNTSFNNRLFNQCFHLYQDKNVQPRLYSSTFLQIFLLKHGSKLDSINLETINKWLSKGVADPNTTVRESMRATFWIYFRRFKDEGALIFHRLDANVQKNLERSRPKEIGALSNSLASGAINSRQGLAPEKKRQSIREFVAKQRDRRSVSGPQMVDDPATGAIAAQITTAELGRPSRIGVPQRVRASSGDYKHLQKKPSRGSLQQMGSNVQHHQSVPSSAESNRGECAPAKGEFDSLRQLLKSSLTRERTEGVGRLEALLATGNEIADISSSLFDLIIIDTLLLKPLLKYPDFFKLIEPQLALKVLSVNKGDLSVISKAVKGSILMEGLINMVTSLESLKFDNAPSVMFHIKYKNLFLDFAIKNIYEMLNSDNLKELNNNPGLHHEVCQAIFPLCISDYPKYDELILHLNSSQPESFNEILRQSTAYIKSKINSILELFRDGETSEPNHDHSFTEQNLKDMTMINPSQRGMTDSILSLRAGFNTDMTMIMPRAKYASNDLETQANGHEDKMDVDDIEYRSKGVEDNGKVDYMSDIFNQPRETGIADGTNSNIEQSFIEPESKKDEEMGIERGEVAVQTASPNSLISHSESPFLDHSTDDDEIQEDQVSTQDPSDKITQNLTNQISEIYISPEKRIFKTPDRKSLNSIIDQADPFFNNTKKQIKIFEDVSSTKNADKRIMDFELEKFEFPRGDQELTVESIIQFLKRLERDQACCNDLNGLIQSIHYMINKADLLQWMKDCGFEQIMTSLLQYFNGSINITKPMCFKGLIIFRELLIVSDYLGNLITKEQVIQIWNILCLIVENLKDFKNDIFISVDELVDNLISLKLESCRVKIIENCYTSLRTKRYHLLLTSFFLMTLTKTIEQESLSLDHIREVDSAIFNFLSSKEVEIRRLTIIVYSKCKKKLQEFNQNSHSGKVEICNDKTVQDTYNVVFEKLSLPQRKLIDYYSDT